jgi:hypothetical protein
MSLRQFASRLLFVVLLAALAPLALATRAHGGTYLNTLEPTATLHGRQLDVTVIYGCDPGQHLALRVTATQRHVGAVAEGTQQGTCAVDVQHIPVLLTTRGVDQFVPSAEAAADQVVEVCALATTMTRGHIDDSHQWCKDLTLVEP